MAFHWLAHDPLAVYEFQYDGPVNGNWVRARYKASVDELVAHYDRWETIGAPEIRSDASADVSASASPKSR